MENGLIWTLNDKEYAQIDEVIYDNRHFIYLMALDQTKILFVEKILKDDNVTIKSINDDETFEKVKLLFAKKIQKEINS